MNKESYEKYYQEVNGTSANEITTNFSSEVEFLSQESQNNIKNTVSDTVLHTTKVTSQEITSSEQKKLLK